ncbi:MAG: F0F1 ATP synthase subunit B [Dehalococcoidia bacterium]|nr:F0F1 ATP synthase subunit B [Dehalococcoidia bacterium]
MGELFSSLGISWQVLTAQLVAFIILFLLLRRFAYKPIVRMLDQRATKIKESMEQADLVRQQNLQAEERMKAQLDEARREGQKILAQAEQVGERMKEEAKSVARKEAESIVARAQSEIRMERDQAVDQLRREVVDIAIMAAEKVVKESMDKESHRRLIDEVIRQSGGLKKG